MFRKSFVSLFLYILAVSGDLNAATKGPPDRDPWYLTGYILAWVTACNHVKYSEVKERRDKVKALASDGKVSAIDFGKYKRGWAKMNGAQAANCRSARSKENLAKVDAFLLRAELTDSSPTTANNVNGASVSITDAECDVVGMGRRRVDEIFVSVKYDAAFKVRIRKEIEENRAKKLCLDKYRGNRPRL